MTDENIAVSSNPSALTEIDGEKFNIPGILGHLDQLEHASYGGSERSYVNVVRRLIVSLVNERGDLLKRLSDETTASTDCSTGTGGVTLAQMAENIKHGLDPYAAAETSAASKRAYYETHEPPHCPTCDCGAEEAGETTAVTPEFAAGFERGLVETTINDLRARFGDRDAPFWQGFEFALEELSARLNITWAELPTEEPAEKAGESHD